ncbi:metallophosphoesterase [Candidatus Pacearchaeota archaeon]|nr:metallophosphoesterase [Candidatus Pacearchaeota archaeon]
MGGDILRTIRKNGLLLEKEIFELINSLDNNVLAKNFLEQIERVSGQKLITRNVLSNNIEYVRSFVGKLEGDEKGEIENVFVKLGISLEVRREGDVKIADNKERGDYKIFYSTTSNQKKLEVKDFTGNFRSRFQQSQRILMARQDLRRDLVSINKISSDRARLSVIGIVTEKHTTKNKNLIFKFEDLTGEIKAIVKFDNKEVFSKAEELMLDDIVGLRASGNRDMLFIHDIFYPDCFLHEKTKFEKESCVAFLSDVHCGSDRHLGKSFEKFLDWINSDDEAAKKIRYIFFTGDNVDGVGIFPGQEDVLNLKSMEEQYELLASYLRKVPSRITMFLCPGQHDAIRVAEPQPIISRKYAYQLYDIDNLILASNPSMVHLVEGKKEFKILMYHGASIHTFINEIRSLREMKAHRCPAKAVREMLKRRHLAPVHSEVVYIPDRDKDPLMISEVPDVLCTGEVHRLDVDNYNGVLIITGSCWQAQTSFEEKIGNIPDPCKVPVLNLKTRELKIFDFGDEKEIGRWM